jgi:ElaB/YqjD/DUF883 family membrane-anchored ribosome-binding protein
MTPTQIKKLAEGIKVIADTTGELLKLSSEVAETSKEKALKISEPLEEVSHGLVMLMDFAKNQSKLYA